MAKYQLKAWLVENTVTTDNLTDKIPVLETARNVDAEFVIERMIAEDTGLRRETLRHVFDLYNRIVSGLVLEGYSVNTGLFRVVAQLKGVIEEGKWDDERNSIYASFTQGTYLRQQIADTTVKILGEKGDVMYISATQDASTRATNGSATAGRTLTLNGKNLRVIGTDPAVGIKLTSSTGVVTALPEEFWVVNDPSKLIVLLPATLTDGEYELTVTTQYVNSKTLLKAPRSTTYTIYIGGAPAGDGTGDGGDGSGDTGGGKDDDPLG